MRISGPLYTIDVTYRYVLTAHTLPLRVRSQQSGFRRYTFIYSLSNSAPVVHGARSSHRNRYPAHKWGTVEYYASCSPFLCPARLCPSLRARQLPGGITTQDASRISALATPRSYDLLPVLLSSFLIGPLTYRTCVSSGSTRRAPVRNLQRRSPVGRSPIRPEPSYAVRGGGIPARVQSGGLTRDR